MADKEEIKLESIFDDEDDVLILRKKVQDIENALTGLNPRNLSGISSKRLRDATRANLFGSGSDGDVTITGTTTLTRDMFYDNLVVDSTGILNTASFRVFAKTSLTK